MRLIVARCEVTYTGRLNAVPAGVDPAADAQGRRLRARRTPDAGGYKPLNWMTPPTVIEDSGDARRRAQARGPSEDRLEIRLARGALGRQRTTWARRPALEKDGVERDLQLLLADEPDAHRARACGSSSASGRPTSAPST